MRTKRTSSSTPVTCCFAQLRRSMRHAPRFTGRASIGVVRSSAGARLGKNHLQNGTEARKSSGRDPPAPTVAARLAASVPAFFRARRQCLRDRRQWEISLPARAWPIAVLGLNNSKNNRVLSVVARPTFRSVREVLAMWFAQRWEYWRTTRPPTSRKICLPCWAAASTGAR